MADISIIGAGKLGTSLGRTLHLKGYSIKAVSCLHASSSKESRRIIGEGNAFTDPVLAAREGQAVFLCVPDPKIAEVTRLLSRSDIQWDHRIVFHCSGLLSSEVLGPLRAKGAAIASFHPIQTFSNKETPAGFFRGIYYGLEGQKEALEFAENIIRKLGGRFLVIPRKDKALYHTACSFASNLFVALLDISTALLKEAGLNEHQAFEVLYPLVEGTLHNAKKFDIETALTGPVIRGDVQSVEQHLEALKKFPLFREAYSKLGMQSLRIAKRKKLSNSKIMALRERLEGK